LTILTVSTILTPRVVEHSLMDTRARTVDTLQATRDELQRRGMTDLAVALEQAIAELQKPESEPLNTLMTTGEAARLLGVASVNTIKRWVADGMLDGFRRGGRVLVSRASVERMLNDSRLTMHQRRERALDDALAPFDAGDDLPSEAPATWYGRRPWATDAARAT
jgi:excisionase family DNA binding protein